MKLSSAAFAASASLLFAIPAFAVVSRSHGAAILGIRMQGLRSSVPQASIREWADIKLVEWENPGQPDQRVCAQVFKDRVYRIVVSYDPKYGNTRFDDFIAFMRLENGKRPRWTMEAQSHRTVGIWQDTFTRVELWAPGRNTASYTVVMFDLKNPKGLLESKVNPRSLAWRGCGGDQR